MCVVANGVGPGASQSLGCRNVDTGSTQIGFLEAPLPGSLLILTSGLGVMLVRSKLRREPTSETAAASSP